MTLIFIPPLSSGPFISCRGLDEGLDIPEIDAAVLVASTQRPRQRIQRIGRTFRKTRNGRRLAVITSMP
ncbi:MAG: helicase-related protein [Chthoniobacterales bacterium]